MSNLQSIQISFSRHGKRGNRLRDLCLTVSTDLPSIEVVNGALKGLLRVKI